MSDIISLFREMGVEVGYQVGLSEGWEGRFNGFKHEHLNNNTSLPISVSQKKF